MIISIHVPKTAGTLLGLMFDLAVGRRVFYDYLGEHEPLPSFFGEAERFFCGHFRVVHGHFHLDKYYSLFSPAFYTISFRHPVERVISQYRHILNDPNANDRRRDDIQSGRMNLVDFAAESDIGNAQSIYLGAHSLADLDFIFITEELPKCIRLFNYLHAPQLLSGAVLDVVSATQLRVNDSASRGGRTLVPTRSEKVAIYNHCSQDCAIYSEATERFVALFRRLEDRC